MFLTTRGRYAVMAILDMVVLSAKGKKCVSLSILSERQNISISYLEQLFLLLKKCGIVTSVKGPKGGYVLALTPEEIKIANVIDAVGEDIKSTKCTDFKSNSCNKKSNSNSRCIGHNLWNHLDSHLQLFMTNISLRNVIDADYGRFKIQN